MSAKLGEILVRENLITPQQLRETLEYQRANGGRLGSNLVKLGYVSDDVVTAVLSRQYGVPSINLDLFQIDKAVIKLISEDVALKYSVLPISKSGATLTLAMADPTNVFAMDDIKFMTGLNVEPVIASESSIQLAIGKYYTGSAEIDIFDAAIAAEAEKVAVSTNGNGNGNGNGHRTAFREDTAQKLHASDLDVSLDKFEFTGDGDEFEVVEEQDEIDLAALA